MTQPNLPFEPATASIDKVGQAIKDAIVTRREVLTPQGAMYLFDLSEAAVRKARLKDGSGVRFALTVTDRPVSMLDLDWAVKQWGPMTDCQKARLDEMRTSRHLFCLYGEAYLILHPKPIACEGPEGEMDLAGSGHLVDRAAS